MSGIAEITVLHVVIRMITSVLLDIQSAEFRADKDTFNEGRDVPDSTATLQTSGVLSQQKYKDLINSSI